MHVGKRELQVTSQGGSHDKSDSMLINVKNGFTVGTNLQLRRQVQYAGLARQSKMLIHQADIACLCCLDEVGHLCAGHQNQLSVKHCFECREACALPHTVKHLQQPLFDFSATTRQSIPQSSTDVQEGLAQAAYACLEASVCELAA